jgi:hypothetical protein
MNGIQSEAGIELPPLISTDPVLSTNMVQQLGIFNVNRLALIIAAKTSTEKKLNEIFRLLETYGKTNLSNDELSRLLGHAIDACRCKEETNTRLATRLFLFDRTVRKETHLKE